MFCVLIRNIESLYAKYLSINVFSLQYFAFVMAFYLVFFFLLRYFYILREYQHFGEIVKRFIFSAPK